MAESSVLPVQEALVTAIQGWAGFATLLKGDKAYLRNAQDVVPPYVIVGQATAPDLNVGHLMRPGQLVIVTLHCWAADVGAATDVFQELYRCLHRRTLTMTDHLLLRGGLAYVTDLDDQSRQAYQVTARYTARTVEKAA